MLLTLDVAETQAFSAALKRNIPNGILAELLVHQTDAEIADIGMQQHFDDLIIAVGEKTLAAESINISDMTNKSRDKFAYTMVDVEQRADEETVERIRRIDGVLRVRVL